MKNKYAVINSFFGLIVSIIIMVILLVNSNSVIKTVSYSLFGGFLIIYYIFKSIYIAINKKSDIIFLNLSRSFFMLSIISLNILVCLIYLKGVIGWVFFGVGILLGIIGIIFNSINTKKYYILYLIMVVLLMLIDYLFLLLFTVSVSNLYIYILLCLSIFTTTVLLLYSFDSSRYLFRQSFYIVLNQLFLGLLLIYC